MIERKGDERCSFAGECKRRKLVEIGHLRKYAFVDGEHQGVRAGGSAELPNGNSSTGLWFCQGENEGF
jgi:hypothetical protein